MAGVWLVILILLLHASVQPSSLLLYTPHFPLPSLLLPLVQPLHVHVIVEDKATVKRERPFCHLPSLAAQWSSL